MVLHHSSRAIKLVQFCRKVLTLGPHTSLSWNSRKSMWFDFHTQKKHHVGMCPLNFEAFAFCFETVFVFVPVFKVYFLA